MTLVNYRPQQAERILSAVGAVKYMGSGIYAVKSQFGVGTYQVEHSEGWKCNCPDHILRSLDCKHILAAQLSLLKPARKKPLVHSESYWTNYNISQTEEIRLFGELLHDLALTVDEPIQIGRGRRFLPIATKIFCSVLKVYSQKSSRRSAGMYQSAVENRFINQVPHFNTASKFLMKEENTAILHDLVRLSAIPLTCIEKDFAIDSSGFTTSSFGDWQKNKWGVRSGHRIPDWLKVHIMSGVLSNIVTDVKITKSTAHDSPQLPELLMNTAANFKMEEVSGDKAYSSRKNHTLIDSVGATPYIPFKKNNKGKGKGSPIWNKAFYFFKLHQDEFYEHYHKRSNVESTFGAIKAKMGERLKSKHEVAQKNEMLFKILAYNITVLIRCMYEHNIVPIFFRPEN